MNVDRYTCPRCHDDMALRFVSSHERICAWADESGIDRTFVVSGVNSTPEYEAYRADPGLAAAVDARHAAFCGCEKWVGCCLLRPGFLETAVQELRR